MTLTPEERELLARIADMLAIPARPEEVRKAERDQEWATLAGIQRALEIPATLDAVTEAERELGAAPRVLSEARRGRRMRWSLAAAVLVVVLAGVASGLAYQRYQGDFLGTSGWTGIGPWSARGYRFDELGVAPEAKVLDELSISLSPTTPGTAFAISEEFESGFDLCAFGEDGRPVWSARRDWPDWSETLGLEDVRFRGMKRLYTARIDGELEESICLVAVRLRQSYLCVIDGATGRRRSHVFFDGDLAAQGRMEAIQTLPAEASGRRPLLVGGSTGAGADARAILLVLGPEGRLRQWLAFPALVPSSWRVSYLHNLRANWQVRPVQVTAYTSEEIHFSMPFEGGRLQTARATVLPSDSLLRDLRRMLGDAELARRLEPFGGEARLTEGLAEAVVTVDGDLPRRWRRW